MYNFVLFLEQYWTRSTASRDGRSARSLARSASSITTTIYVPARRATCTRPTRFTRQYAVAPITAALLRRTGAI